MDKNEIINEYYSKIFELLGQTKVSFLIGAGCSLCAGLPLMSKLTIDILDAMTPTDGQDEFEKKVYTLLHSIKDTYSNVNNVSIEDYLSEMQDINAILRRQKKKGISSPIYKYNDNEYTFEHSEKLLKLVKLKIKDILGKKVDTIKYHRNFCKLIHYDMNNGRKRTRGVVNYFLLNYDTLIEDALAIEGVAFNDGFVGGATAWWNPESFGGNELVESKRVIDAKVYKLHGSIDWIRASELEFPIRLRNTIPSEEIIGDGEPVVIYPSSMKYKETQYDPYAQMMMSFRKTLCDTSSHVLVIMGYGFNDDHINIEILNGIKGSDGALSVLILLGTSELPKVIEEWLENPFIASQILILGKNGVWKNGERILTTKDDIEWYKFENVVSTLESGGANV